MTQAATRGPVYIFGSCVSRDPFSFTEPNGWEIGTYLARQSMVGIVDPPLEADPEWYGDLGGWERKCILNDLRKDGLPTLLSGKPVALLLDFIDERFDLLRIGETRVSNIKQLRQPGFLDRYGAEGVVMPRLDPTTTDAWRRGFDIFIAKAIDRFGEEKIILHEALWAPLFKDAEGKTAPFGQPYRDLIPRHNDLLETYFEHVHATAPRIRKIRVAKKHQFADPDHRWSKEPFHYIHAYYAEFVAKFDKLMTPPRPARKRSAKPSPANA